MTTVLQEAEITEKPINSSIVESDHANRAEADISSNPTGGTPPSQPRAIELPASSWPQMILAPLAALFVIPTFFSCSAFAILLCVLLVVDLCLLIPGMLLGFGGDVVNAIIAHSKVLYAFGSSLLGIASGPSFRMLLQRDEAPRLFDAVQGLCDKASVPFPQQVYLEIGSNAWVKSVGLFRKNRTTQLGIGFDLLAGFSEPETIAVMAHEITHAQRVRWETRRIALWGQSRLGFLATRLEQLNIQLSEEGNPSTAASLALRMVNSLGSKTTILLASSSRQDEYDADQGGAEMAGLSHTRSALKKAERITSNSSKILWPERMARLEISSGLTPWLVNQLRTEAISEPILGTDEPLNPYSTHPSTRSRLDALPEPMVEDSPDDSLGLNLLNNPEATAKRLANEFREFMQEEERLDTVGLRQWTTRLRRKSEGFSYQGIGIVLISLAVLAWVSMAWVTLPNECWAIILLLSAGAGVLMLPTPSEQDHLRLQIPTIETLSQSKTLAGDALNKQIKQIESELLGLIDQNASFESQAQSMVEVARDALAQCDYARGWTAAVLATRVVSDSTHALICLAVSAAGLGNHAQSRDLLHRISRTASIWNNKSVTWGFAWASMLLQDWRITEALLGQLLESSPDHPTLLFLIATAQSHRGKTWIAQELTQKVAELLPEEAAPLKQLVELYLRSGSVADATIALQKLRSIAPTDSNVHLLGLQKELLLQDPLRIAEAENECRKHAPSPMTLVAMSWMYADARKPKYAECLFEEATKAGHYPEALIGLAKMKQSRGDKAGARTHLLEALNLSTPTGEGSIGVCPHVRGILLELLSLQRPQAGCRVWRGSLTNAASPDCLCGLQVNIYANDFTEATQQFKIILNALRPGMPPLLNDVIQIEGLPDELQPSYPLPVGVELAV